MPQLVTYTPGTRPGRLAADADPVPFDPPAAADNLPAALPGWGQVTPFVLRRSSQFEPRWPTASVRKRYARDYNEVKAIGEKNSSNRTAEQTSSRGSGTNPPRPDGQNRTGGGQSQGLDSWETARLLALVNLAMADGFIAGFEP